MHRVQKVMGIVVQTGGNKVHMFIFMFKLEEESSSNYYIGNNLNFFKSIKSEDGIVQIQCPLLTMKWPMQHQIATKCWWVIMCI